jgi:predicted RND superfamily exporter protein
VDENFFFSSEDPQFREQARIDRIFPSDSQLIVSVAAPDISSASYLNRIGQLTAGLENVKSVTSVQSLTSGPKDFEDATKSPFWRRLLIANPESASNIVIFAAGNDTEHLIGSIEAVVAKYNRHDFRIEISGAPYVAEMIRRNLRHDFNTFTITSVFLFGIAMGVLFRSWRITAGLLATCSSAVLLTLLVQAIFRQKIGVLTANITTIVFVVTLSHLVYMTFNWQTLAHKNESTGDLATKAWRMTFPASFWSMACATLGFASLLIVPAKPLRELGVGGVTGSVIALVCAYLMYPSFLKWTTPKQTRTVMKDAGSEFWNKRFLAISAITVLATAFLGVTGIPRLNTDPTLFDYFKKGRQPREGLAYIDRNGGSNPLIILITPREGGKLSTKEQYQKMWELQDDLEQHKGVGTVLSLPVLMAEGHRHAFAFLFSWDHLLKMMNSPKHQRVASTFITRDHSMAAFYLRMEERTRTKSRIRLVNDLKAIVRKNGFVPAVVGGVYYLQGELARLVASSLKEGLFWLAVFFTIIAFIVGRSLRTTAAMIISLSLVPASILGGIGFLHIPVDLISAPATNICIGIAIDSMVHLIFGVRRAQKEGKKGWESWVAAREEQWRGIVYSDVVIAAGFGIFALSNFPPTQRFGLVVLAGTIVDILANLFVLPVLGGAYSRKPKPDVRSIPGSQHQTQAQGPLS